MNININNWEAYAVDYYDGNLSAEMQKELLAFFDTHPELKEEFSSFEHIAVSPSHVEYRNKNSLKHPGITPFGKINENNFEEHIVLFVDGEMTADDKEEFLNFIEKNGFLKKDIELISATRLKPDKSIVFADKQSLKKRPVLPLFIRWSAVAAIFLAGFLLLKPYFSNNNSTKQNFAVRVNRLPALKYTSTPRYGDSLTLLISRKTAQSNPEIKKPVNRRNINSVLSMKPLEHRETLSTMNKTGIINPGFTVPSPPSILVIDDNSGKNRGLAMKIISRPFKKAGEIIAKRKRMAKQSAQKEPAAIKIIDNGITAINKLTGGDIVVAKVYNNGNLTGYQLYGNNWQIKCKINRR